MEAKDIEATRVAQGILASVDPKFRVDGHWGSFTEKAFVSAPASTRSAIVAAVSSFNRTPDQLKAAFAIEKLSVAGSLREKTRSNLERKGSAMDDTVVQAISDAARITGVSASTLTGMVSIESRGNPAAVNGSSHGLMQVQPAAWLEAADWLRAKTGKDIGSWTANSLVASFNALAGAAYVQINSARLKASGFTDPITPQVLYLAHQQGAAGFVELWRAATGRKPVTAYVTDAKMLGNPPQDGQGATTDKRRFYQRWMAVAQKKLG